MTSADVWLIAPAFNEAENVPALVAACRRMQRQRLPRRSVKLLVVDDGSIDTTFHEIRVAASASDEDFRIVGTRLSRNFGQQAAIQAGIEHAFRSAAPGSLFVLLDADLQHPPELVPDIVAALDGGADHVQMVRADDDRLPYLKRATSRIFYRLLNLMSDLKLAPGSSDFRGMSWRFVDSYLKISETGRFHRGLFHWLGFERREIAYQPMARNAGATRYSLRRMSKLALEALLQFSSRPLILISAATVTLSAAGCFSYLVYEGIRFARGAQFVLGWPTLIFAVSCWGGLLAFNQLLLSLYVARIFDEVKSRPVFLVSESVGEHDSSSSDHSP